jgi:hypothetical protein
MAGLLVTMYKPEEFYTADCELKLAFTEEMRKNSLSGWSIATIEAYQDVYRSGFYAYSNTDIRTLEDRCKAARDVANQRLVWARALKIVADKGRENF